MSWQPGRTLYDIEKETIYEALRFYQNNRTRTASSLGICERTLRNKLSEYEGDKNGTEIGNGEKRETGGSEQEVPSSPARIPVESTPRIPPKQQMPLRKRQEV